MILRSKTTVHSERTLRTNRSESTDVKLGQRSVRGAVLFYLCNVDSVFHFQKTLQRPGEFRG